ncbi:MAG: hypothetical protein ACOCWQ_02075 [Nanoarchaeota archaeon]
MDLLSITSILVIIIFMVVVYLIFRSLKLIFKLIGAFIGFGAIGFILISCLFLWQTIQVQQDIAEGDTVYVVQSGSHLTAAQSSKGKFGPLSPADGKKSLSSARTNGEYDGIVVVLHEGFIRRSSVVVYQNMRNGLFDDEQLARLFSDMIVDALRTNDLTVIRLYAEGDAELYPEPVSYQIYRNLPDIMQEPIFFVAAMTYPYLGPRMTVEGEDA